MPAAPAPAVAVADRKSVAVLPFANLSGRAEDAYLADGLQEEVLNALARLRDMKVISRTSVMQYRDQTHNAREIGERLGVGTILEGSIRRDGNTLRLTVQLIDSRDDNHLFAANYDRDMTHVLELQSAVARQVAEALSATLGRAERGELDRVGTNSGDAYDRYLRAVALYRRPVPSDFDGLVEPMRLLGEALAFDPDYADALALLSQARTWTFFGGHRAADGEAARQAFERALAIDPQLPEAQLARGLYAMYVTENLDLALADLTAVVQRRPSSSAAHYSLGFALRRRARFAEALEQQARALDLDPLNEIYHHALLTTLQGLRRFPELDAHLKLYAQRFPNSPDPYLIRARVESYMTHSAEPLRSFLRDHGTPLDADFHRFVEAEIATEERRYLDAVRLWDAIPVMDPLARGLRVGVLYLEGGDAARAEQTWRGAERAAEQLLKSGTSAVDTKELAMIQSLLGEHAAALETIEVARAKQSEARDATNGPGVSFTRSVILVRAGRREEGYAEVARLLRVPFGSPLEFLEARDPVALLLEDDPHYDELLHRPPRL
jgi:TolB-like protein/lipoprotein NlpI